MAQFSVSLDKIATQLNMETLYSPVELKNILIETDEVNRPGLLLTGYDEFFDPQRIQILGNAEMGYLERLPVKERCERVHNLFVAKPPTVVITRGLSVFDCILEYAKEYGVPVLTTPEATSSFMSGVISILSVDLAPRVTRHGVLVEVYGEGILILGDSGVGKSETAVELLKRGHRLIADDAVELRRVSNRTIFGQAPENIRHFVELRGIGIINVARIFGAGAVKTSEKIELVVELEPWDKHKNYSRTGLENNKIDILGLQLPLTVIPVMPGRNLAVILEIAAINNRQKAMGYNAAVELLGQLGLKNDITQELTKMD
ncbi:HPr(Ser) kinase/phosphatase [Ruminococcaceae bacterium OttesenSCG-928-A16]|nr:HPr(Ser) kinase/phosphatase [Ruminococcaceae bacterium OttesenSCG-928-A16]